MSAPTQYTTLPQTRTYINTDDFAEPVGALKASQNMIFVSLQIYFYLPHIIHISYYLNVQLQNPTEDLVTIVRMFS